MTFLVCRRFSSLCRAVALQHSFRHSSCTSRTAGTHSNTTYLSLYLSILLSICLCLSVCLFIYLLLYQIIYLFVCLSTSQHYSYLPSISFPLPHPISFFLFLPIFHLVFFFFVFPACSSPSHSIIQATSFTYDRENKVIVAMPARQAL